LISGEVNAKKLAREAGVCEKNRVEKLGLRRSSFFVAPSHAKKLDPLNPNFLREFFRKTFPEPCQAKKLVGLYLGLETLIFSAAFFA